MELSKLTAKASKKLDISRFTGDADHVTIRAIPLKNRADLVELQQKGIDKDAIQTYILENGLTDFTEKDVIAMSKDKKYKKIVADFAGLDRTEYKIKLLEACIDSEKHSFTDIKIIGRAEIEQIGGVLPALFEFLVSECENWDKEFRLGEQTASI